MILIPHQFVSKCKDTAVSEYALCKKNNWSNFPLKTPPESKIQTLHLQSCWTYKVERYSFHPGVFKSFYSLASLLTSCFQWIDRTPKSMTLSTHNRNRIPLKISQFLSTVPTFYSMCPNHGAVSIRKIVSDHRTFLIIS